MPLKKALLSGLIDLVVRKTFKKKDVKENLHQLSTKVAVVAAGVAGAIEASPHVQEAVTGVATAKSEAELITQLICAAVALFLYYRDDKGGKPQDPPIAGN
jgi:hypothetical protein